MKPVCLALSLGALVAAGPATAWDALICNYSTESAVATITVAAAPQFTLGADAGANSITRGVGGLCMNGFTINGGAGTTIPQQVVAPIGNCTSALIMVFNVPKIGSQAAMIFRGTDSSLNPEQDCFPH